MKLNPEFKIKLLEALRSGKYKQTTNQLHNAEDNSYCCLGVACEIAGVDKELIDSELCISKPIFTKYPILEPLVARKGSITDDETENVKIVDTLVDMNDGRAEYLKNQQNFSQIADFIEENL